jgi:hypothetical protein
LGSSGALMNMGSKLMDRVLEKFSGEKKILVGKKFEE